MWLIAQITGDYHAGYLDLDHARTWLGYETMADGISRGICDQCIETVLTAEQIKSALFKHTGRGDQCIETVLTAEQIKSAAFKHTGRGEKLANKCELETRT